MLLAVDVGNTNMVFGIFERDKLIGSFRLSTDANKTSDEIGIQAFQYFKRFNINHLEIEDVIIASVVPQVMYSLTNAMKRYFNRTPIIVDDDIDSGMSYEGDEKLGTDRAVTMVAAIEKYGTPLIVIDFGTATTVDAVSSEGTYMGGTISAGIKISAEVLYTKTAMLPRIELVRPPSILGNSTITQMQAGAVGGYIGSMEYIITHMKEEMGYEKIRVVATGGLARLVSDYTDSIELVDSQLTLDGLKIIYEKHMGIS